jgi:hypothetical protein
LRVSSAGRKRFELLCYRFSLKIVALQTVQHGPMPAPGLTIAFAASEGANQPTEPTSFPSRLLQAAIEPCNPRIVMGPLLGRTELPKDMELRKASSKAVCVIRLAVGIGLPPKYRYIGTSNETNVFPR